MASSSTDSMDGRRREELGRLRHQGRGHLAAQVRLTARFIREGVEDAEGRRAEAQREPCAVAGLLLDDRQPALQELLHIALLARLRLQAHSRPTCTFSAFCACVVVVMDSPVVLLQEDAQPIPTREVASARKVMR